MMDDRILGQTGMRVSAIGFGGAPIGILNYLNREDRDSDGFRAEARAAIAAAVAGGINYFDTAPVYGDGRSEKLFGDVLEAHRPRVFIATKFKTPEGTTPERLTDSFKASLERLRTNHVDVLQFHGLNFTDAAGDALLASCVPGWLAEMKSKGLCRFSGLTAETPSGAVERLVCSGHFDVLQIGYNLTAQSACDYRWEAFGIIPTARALGLGIVTMRTSTSGFIQGVLCKRFPILDGRALTRLAIEFVLSTPEVDCALVGMQTVRDVEDNLQLISDGASRLDLMALNERTR